jgi:hypothetical protein
MTTPAQPSQQTGGFTLVEVMVSMTGEAARLGALPFDLLAAGTTCVSVREPPFPHTRCSTVNNVSSKVNQVTVVVTPSGTSLLQPVTTSFNRTISGNGKPLKSQ